MTDSDRIADQNYQPTDDDVIRARLRTLGVQEYRFVFDHGEYDLASTFEPLAELSLEQDERWARNGGYTTWEVQGVM